MSKYIFFFLIFISFVANAQQSDTTKTLDLQEVTVTSFRENALKKTALNITALKVDSLNRLGNFNLTDLIAKTPGITMLSTGVAIAKPVIRGLYGNRILVLLAGLKFDNQQWQEEHGLGLSDLGLSNVELIKGPMSVLYGSEAIGGIINLIEEQKPIENQKISDFSIRLNTNTLGGLMQGGYKVNKGNKWFRIRLGLENNADYSDGKNQRVLNSRFDGYYLKTSYGFQRKNWISNTHYSASFNRFGFIFNDIYTFITPDARQSRNLSENPNHMVLLNILSSENKIYFNKSKLSVNIGVQSNERLENEGGGKISLNMHLLTLQYLLKWEKQLSKINTLILSNLGSFEDNTNFGARKIVPDARMQESNLSAYLESDFDSKIIVENGISVGEKWLKTYFTPTVNNPEKEIHPFGKFSPYYNVFSGVSFIPNENFKAKFNIATGVRIPNLAELSSNGLHEGVFTYEIGSPLLKNEQNIAFNFLANYKMPLFEAYLSPFYNHFFNYVYLAPTKEEWFGFPVYRYRQQNATQYGTELTMKIKPTTTFNIGISYAAMSSKTADSNYTPFIPAQKLTPSVWYQFSRENKHAIQVFANADYCLAQNQVYPNEIKTPQYLLLNAGFSTSFVRENKTIDVSVMGNNLLNTAYYDHLSRFKYFNLLNIGRNIAFSIKLKTISSIKKN